MGVHTTISMATQKLPWLPLLHTPPFQRKAAIMIHRKDVATPEMFPRESLEKHLVLAKGSKLSLAKPLGSDTNFQKTGKWH